MSEVLFEYIDKEKSNKHLGPKTLILDLDETLVHSWTNPTFVGEYKIYSNPEIYRLFHPLGSHQITYSMHFDINGDVTIWGLYRPNVFKFLSFVGEYFENIIVWSAGIKPYVESIVRQLFLESGLSLPKIVWSRDKCSNYQGYHHKPISTLTYDMSSRHYESVKIDPKSTVIIDDKQYTFMENPYNGILIPPYHPGKDRPNGIPTLDDLLDRTDNSLLKLIDFFERSDVKNTTDIRMINKEIFK